MPQPEPWLRGPLDGLHPIIAHVFYTFQQCREELASWTADIDDHRLWQPFANNAPSLGFHLRHITGSVDRLTTYLTSQPLSPNQLAFLENEPTPGGSRLTLLEEMNAVFAQTEATLRQIPPATFQDVRTIGRAQLPSTVAGLIVHLAEHTQRHLGQAVLTAKLLGDPR